MLPRLNIIPDAYETALFVCYAVKNFEFVFLLACYGQVG